MKSKKEALAVDPSTEEKIKEAARIIFHKKGFAGTRTRDIAEEAGINLALLNYYFRSKEKLFHIIMFESVHQFLQSIREIFNDDQTTLENKIEKIVTNYIDLLTVQPDIPLFILSELRRHPDELISEMNIKDFFMKSYFIQQLQEEIGKGKIAAINPLHFIINLLSMTVFPFVSNPLIKGVGNISQKEFDELMLQRKVLIPKWIKAMLKAG